MTTSAPVRFGLLRLTDSAPVIVALERGLFRELGLDVVLSVEPSWANIADKLAYGLLDAASLLPPLALAAALGLRGPPGRLLVPMGLSSGGNTVTLGREAAHAVLERTEPRDALAAGRRFGEWLRDQPAPPRFAVVHAFSTHNLLLRYWLAASGIDPDRAIQTVVIPPEQVEQALAQGRIAGFCAGAPWGELAAQNGSGKVLLGTSDIWNAHPEKCLAVAAPWAAANPMAVRALLRGLLQAQRLCERTDMTPWIASLLAQPPLALPRDATLACLPGGGAKEQARFAPEAVAYPWQSHAAWFLSQMRRWRWLAADNCPEDAAKRIYAPDLLASAAAEEHLAWPAADRKQLRGFCDEAIFDQDWKAID